MESARSKEWIAWLVSYLVTFLLLIIISVLWYDIAHNYKPSPHEVSSYEELNAKIQSHLSENFQSSNRSDLKIIPTGIFLQSFEFLSSSTIQVNGYIWQKIPHDYIDKGIRPGFVLPEAKDLGRIELAYKIKYPDYTVFGWNFTGITLIQEFNYSAYPFDIHSVWIRLWPKDFYRHVILAPDLKSYEQTTPGKTFGIESDITELGFEIKETFFDMPILEYDTNFGLVENLRKQNSLELYFNTIIKRNFFTPLLVNLLPLFLIWCILFLVTMMISLDKAQKGDFKNISPLSLFSVLGATVFSVLIMHIGLRRTFIDQPLLFLEYFYLITYCIIILIAYDIYRVIIEPYRTHHRKKHNILPKTLFWPLILTLTLIITLVEFYLFKGNAIHWYT